MTMLPPDGQLHLVAVRRLDLALDLVAREQRDRVVLVELELLDVVRQHALHELDGFLVDRRAVDQDFADVVREVVAQRAHDGVAFLIDQERRGPRDDDLLDGFPDAQQVVEVPLELFGRAADPGRAHDAAHAVGDLQVLEGLAHRVAFLALDAAGDAARAGVVRHQDDEPAGQADEGRQRRTFGAALFLIDLNDDFLAFAQDFADPDVARFGLLDEVLARDFL